MSDDKEMAQNVQAVNAVAYLSAEVARLRKGIQDILDGNYPHSRTYRPGKCPHGIWFYDDCGICTDEALQALLMVPALGSSGANDDAS